jgi:uncharacterized protein YlxW (UPF0749 family)
VRIDSGRLMVGAAALILGIMVAVQFRLQRVVPPPTQTETLLTLLRQADQHQTALERQVARLQAELDQRLTQEAAARRLAHELTTAEILAGTVPVKGPGIVVQWGNGSAPPAFQIQDIDLLLMVNELRAAGAEAIAINGQRITAETEIRNAGTYILINNAEEAAPFTIEAIGPVSTMIQALRLPGGILDQSVSEGRTMTITPEKSLTLPAAVVPAPQYSKAGTG